MSLRNAASRSYTLGIRTHTYLQIIYLKLNKPVPQNYEHLRERARARAHIEIHIYRGPYTCSTGEKGRHLGAKLTLLRLYRLTSIPRRVPRSPPSFNHPPPPAPRARGIPIAAPVSQTHTLHAPRYPPTSPSLTLVLYLLSVLSNRGSSLLHHSSRPDHSHPRAPLRPPTYNSYVPERPSSYLQNHPLHSRARHGILLLLRRG